MTLEDPRPVLADEVVAALPEDTRRVLLALLRAADRWGEISRQDAIEIARRIARHHAPTARAHLKRLHEARLLDRCQSTGVLIVWTPQQRADAEVFL